jgi:glutamate N-acetyltransferase/amino-acid N-acetyltransferase
MIVQGFKMAAVAAGIKSAGTLDLSLIYSEKPAVAAAVFTQNTFIAAPLSRVEETPGWKPGIECAR